jgi:hypothetical protein
MGRARRGVRGRLWGLQFVLSGYVAATVLWISHGCCVRQLGGSTAEFRENVQSQLDGFIVKLDAKAAKANAIGLQVT